jgi:anhydro-N-acetylmuramic acid kinase
MNDRPEITRPEVTALGLMSGTSCDGIDAAVLRSDGVQVFALGATGYSAYLPADRAALRAAIAAAKTCPRRDDSQPAIAAAARLVTERHGEAVRALLAGQEEPVELIGFHGQTIAHRPDQGWSWQIGDGAALAAQLGITVVDDFRSADMAAGGQGAPLAPLYHRALLVAPPPGLRAPEAWPVAVLNLGGVGNVTWLAGPRPEDRLIAFDCGPGNALLDDWMARTLGQPMDRDGALARTGRVRRDVLARLLDDVFFAQVPPKSLDRDAFSLAPLGGLSPADGAATLAAFTAAGVARACEYFPELPRRWLVCGGGRRNPALMAALAERLEAPVEPVETLGWRGDFLEAECFAYLAARARANLPLSLPQTTGAAKPTLGGRVSLP